MIFRSVFLSLLLVLCCACWVCAAGRATATEDCVSIPPCPDYSTAQSWASLPQTPDKPVDVFYVYPTIYPEASPKNMDITRDDLRGRVQGLLKAQAGVYSASANLFAPYYRQVSFTCLDPDVDMYQNRYFRVGADDVRRAFEYYLAHDNDGRPFILAGHSQGSVVLLGLLRDRMYDPQLREQMVAAYIIGYSVTGQDLKEYPWLKIAQGADDTGVIITYNTQAPGATGSPVLVPGAMVVNPLNWTTDATPADKSQNLGAVFFNDMTGELLREEPHYIGARVNPEVGALEVIPPEKMEIGHFPKGVYHKFDYAFFYRNLQKNVAERIAAYMKKH